jgi:hypothetical protein
MTAPPRTAPHRPPRQGSPASSVTLSTTACRRDSTCGTVGARGGRRAGRAAPTAGESMKKPRSVANWYVGSSRNHGHDQPVAASGTGKGFDKRVCPPTACSVRSRRSLASKGMASACTRACEHWHGSTLASTHGAGSLRPHQRAPHAFADACALLRHIRPVRALGQVAVAGGQLRPQIVAGQQQRVHGVPRRHAVPRCATPSAPTVRTARYRPRARTVKVRGPRRALDLRRVSSRALRGTRSPRARPPAHPDFHEVCVVRARVGPEVRHARQPQLARAVRRHVLRVEHVEQRQPARASRTGRCRCCAAHRDIDHASASSSASTLRAARQLCRRTSSAPRPTARTAASTRARGASA